LDGAVAATQTALAARLTSEPGVAGVTFAANMPGSGGEARVEVAGTGTSAPVRTTRVSESYFGVFDVTVAAGRTFNSADIASPSNRSLVVNRTFVAKVLGGGDAIGRRVRYVRDSANADAWLTIVGVIEDFPTGVEQVDETNALMYHLSRPGEMRRGIALVHVRGQTPAAFAPTMRAVAAAVDPTLQLRKVRPLDTVYAESRRAMLMVALALALIVGSVLLLSTAGIYALMSFTVNQRRREIGVRAALGANPRRVLTGILSRAARQLGLGVTLGLGLSVLVDRLSGGDAMGGNGLVLVPSVAAFMLVVGLLAAAGPARRGLRVSPTEALRAG
jgi:putative ABC transport system permease protein